MPKTFASPSIGELIDARIRVSQAIDAMERQKKELGEQILAQMQTSGEKQAFGELGGYRRQEKLDCEYGQDAYDYAERNQLIALFTPAPSITRAKVMDAHKKNKLTLAQFTRLQKSAGEIVGKWTLVGIAKPVDDATEEESEDA